MVAIAFPTLRPPIYRCIDIGAQGGVNTGRHSASSACSAGQRFYTWSMISVLSILGVFAEIVGYRAGWPHLRACLCLHRYSRIRTLRCRDRLLPASYRHCRAMAAGCSRSINASEAALDVRLLSRIRSASMPLLLRMG